MTFKFAWLVELLQALDHARNDKVLTSARSSNPDHQVVTSWYNRYRHKIDRYGDSGRAFLSCMFPEHCPQRSYNIQEKRLASIFGRALGLGVVRARRLVEWQKNGRKDFSCCVEEVMAECEFDPPRSENEVTLEEIDVALLQLAANSPFSSPDLRRNANNQNGDELINPILRRLQSHEAKWFVRMLLKSYSPVQIPEKIAMEQFHFLLPDLLSIQNSLAVAISLLGKEGIYGLPANPQPEYAKALKVLLGKDMVPQIGTMVKRQPYEKARSIKHCHQLSGKQVMSVERKYDGEYCQIHIDLSKGRDCIQIFSKSGKDSTQDRIRLHGVLNETLSLHSEACRIKHYCILEGELLVWSQSRQTIQPFYKIRRHVLHGGRYLGSSSDSPRLADEYLMIMFYDLILLDNKISIGDPLTKRRQHLKGLITKIRGRSDIGERLLIDFSSQKSLEKLRFAFAKSITQRWEGFVLKGNEDAYFSWKSDTVGIKLKKDYISGLGDTADLCIIGGRLNAKTANGLNIDQLQWSEFYLACLENREDVRRFKVKPSYVVIDVIGHHNISRRDILDLNMKGVFTQLPFAESKDVLDIDFKYKATVSPSHIFKEPFIVEIMGAGFEKPSDCSFFTLRFPRTLSLKIHTDRSPLDTLTFNELQSLAKKSMASPSDLYSQQDLQWSQKLLKADGKSHYVVEKSQSTTPGKSPISARTVSISPCAVKKKPNRTLVRADTAELSSQELVERLRIQTSTPCTSRIGSRVSRTPRNNLKMSTLDKSEVLKGNLCAENKPDQSQSLAKDKGRDTRLGSKSPRREQVTRKDHVHPQTPECTQLCRQTSNSTRLFTSTTELLSQRSSKSTTTTSSVNGKVGGHILKPKEKLSEIINISSTIPETPPVLQTDENKAPQTSWSNFHEMDKKRARTSENQEDITPDQPYAKRLRPRAITSPLSTRSKGNSGTQPKPISPKNPNSCKTVVKLNLNTPRQPNQPPRLPYIRILPAIPPPLSSILICKSMSDAPPEHKDRMQTLLHATDYSFTLSLPHFIQQLSKPNSHLTKHILIVHVINAAAVAQEMIAIGLDLIRACRQAQLNQSPAPAHGTKIIFLDYLALGPDFDPTNRESLQRARRHFCGCLRLNSETYRRTIGEAVWDWEQAVA